jgi:uncharacterized Ntn-hydrolase superfamily protein
MEEKYTELAVRIQEVDSRSKSNSRRIDDNEVAIKELREKQDAIYELTASTKAIATDLGYIKSDVKEVKNGQDRLNEKVVALENRPAMETKKKIDNISEKILWVFIGGISVWILTTILPNIPW